MHIYQSTNLFTIATKMSHKNLINDVRKTMDVEGRQKEKRNTAESREAEANLKKKKKKKKKKLLTE